MAGATLAKPRALARGLAVLSLCVVAACSGDARGESPIELDTHNRQVFDGTIRHVLDQAPPGELARMCDALTIGDIVSMLRTTFEDAGDAVGEWEQDIAEHVVTETCARVRQP